MTKFDLAVIIIISLSILYSVFKGMIREIFSLLSVVGGYLVASIFQAHLGEVFEDSLDNETFAYFLSFLFLFIVTAVGISFAGRAIQKMLKKAGGLSTLDRVVGGLFGFIKGLVLVLILTAPLQYFPDLEDSVTDDSVLASYLDDISFDLMDSIEGGDALDSIKNMTKDTPLEEYTEEEKEKLDDMLESFK